MVYGKKPSGSAWKAWKAFFVAGFGVQKAMWLPEKTSSEIVEAYRTAAAKIVADAEFQKMVKKSLGGYPQLVGQEARQAFNEVLSVPPESKQWVLKWLKERFDVTVK